MKRILVLLPLAFIVLSGCHALKTVKLLKKGDVSSKNFKEQVTFESRAGLIIVNVSVNGHDYHFIFDSGAVNCVTKEVAEELNLKPALDETAKDSEGKTGGIKFAILDELRLGKIIFTKTAAAIVDLRAVPELACLKVDGLIGANLMRKIYWQIDYKKQLLAFSDHLDSLKVPATTYSMSFKPQISGTPVVEVDANGIKSGGNIFDTGSSGGMVLAAPMFKKLLAKDSAIKYVRGVGSNSAGLYGAGFDTSYAVKADLKFGTLVLPSHAIELKRKEGNIGSDFFKDYIITLDWNKQKIYFAPNGSDKNVWSTFGFSAQKKGDELLIAFLYEGSPADLAGLKRGDQILKMNEKNYDPLSDADFCEMIVKPAPWRYEQKVQMLVKSSNGETKSITLERKTMLE